MIRRLSLALAVCLVLGAAAGPAGAATRFTLTGHGWGHGIGMSQYGALGYAQHGWDHERILLHYYTGTTIGLLPTGTKERVLLVDGRSSIHLGLPSPATGRDEAGGSKTLSSGLYRVDRGTTPGKLRLYSHDAGAYVWKGIVGSLHITPGSGQLQLRDRALNGYTDDHWWGDFRILPSGGALDLVDIVPMERYLRGVVPCEVPASWLPEAVQTQAVAARSYAAATAGGGEFDAYPDTRSQMYCPVEQQAAASDAAVAATKRQVVKYGGSVATTFFSSSSGGQTSSLSASWGSPDQPYLVPVRDRYDGANGLNPNHSWAPVGYRPSSLASALGLSGSVGSVDQTIDGPSHRVLSVVVHHGGGDSTLTASDVFSRLHLRSTYFRILQVSLHAPGDADAGRQFQLRGRLWPRPSAFTLEVRKGSDATWTRVTAGVSLDSDGTFTLARSPMEDAGYRLSRSGAFAVSVHVHVHPVLTLARRHGFHGTMLPKLQGATVTLQRDTPGGWVDADSATVAGDGSYHFSTPVTSGSWRVHFARDADHSAGTSTTLVV
ncbi:MAG TPA: SpoIID/LytB domain-containing protein [Gaiellales bacterium]|jgi:stage II sporulation protein D